MTSKDDFYQPVEGKTYTLFGDSESTTQYYETISRLADKILNSYEINPVLETIQKYSPKKTYLKKLVSKPDEKKLISYCLNLIHTDLQPYTRATAEHLKHLALTEMWDKRLATSEEQYHLYMLEIELTNRLNKLKFLSCDKKISLQPYCLQDFAVDCKAKPNGLDYQCKSCSKNCFQNSASKILKESNIEPYIWMKASIGKAAKEAYKNNQTFGVLGIACVPELVWGMRKCSKYQIPVVGIPLNANRCRRWFGECHQNSIDLNELRKLVNHF